MSASGTTAGTLLAASTAAPATSPSALRITLGPGESAAGHYYVPILFTNTGAACSLSGYPEVSYYAGSDQHQVGDAAVHKTGAVPRVVLQPGETAVAWVDQVNVDNYDAAQCGPTPVTGLRVVPPGGTEPVLLPEPGARACSAHMTGHPALGVGAVQRETD